MDDKLHLTAGDTLIVTDIQYDFLPGGSLAVIGGDEVIPVLNRYIDRFRAKDLPIFATRDWHPPNHCSFHAQGGPWPPHCIQGTPGAAFSDRLNLPPNVQIISKAADPDKEAYSSFEGTELNRLLQKAGTRRLFIGGLTTDYCILNTVKDALHNNYAAYFLADAIRAVNVNPGDGDLAIEEMLRLGATALRVEAIGP